MTTAELIKKKEEEKKNPPQETAAPSFRPSEGMSMGEARMAGNGAEVPETTPVFQNNNPNQLSLYEIGKQNAGATNINASTRTSPITTPEYEKFRNEVIGAQQFDVETPEQAAARERRDFIKQGLTGFTEGLSALANLYYTTKGAPSQKLNSQMPELSKRLYAERLERDKKLENFRAWQRAKADKSEERAYQESLYNMKQEAANKSADLKYKRDVALAEIKNALEMGKIDKQTAARLRLEATKAQNAQELEKIRFGNKVALKRTPSASDEKVVDSIQVGEDVYTRNTRLTDNELRTLAKYNQHPEEFTEVEDGDILLGKPGKEVFDWKSAAINAINSGNVPTEVLEQMGFKKGETSRKGKTLPGVESGRKTGKRLNL